MRRNQLLTAVLLSLTLAACAAPDEADEPNTEVTASTAQAEGDEPLIAEPQARVFGSGTSCSPNPCQNGGTCVDLWLGYRCECPFGTSGAQCQTACPTYAQPTAGKCGGLYCGYTQGSLSSKLSPFARCNQSAAFTCSNALPMASGACGRDTKASNPFDSNEQLRPKIAACIRQRPALQGVSISNGCVDCYTTFETCKAGKCLIECLAGDSADCDKCTFKSGCVDALYACTGLPKP